MASKTDICNLALSWLAANLLTDFDTDDTTEAEYCRANYAITRDSVLEDAAWTFATARATLSPIVTPEGSYGYSNYFQIPADCLSVLSCTGNADELHDGNRMDWRVEGITIGANEDIVYIRYLRRIDDESLFSKSFIRAFAARLAGDLAIPLTESKQLEQTMLQKYEMALSDAKANDGFQGANDQIQSNSIILERFSRGGVGGL